MRPSNVLMTLVLALNIKHWKVGMALSRRKTYCFYRSNGTIHIIFCFFVVLPTNGTAR